jgi:hypothetical protein
MPFVHLKWRLILPALDGQVGYLGYSYELWTYKLLTAHLRRYCG